jgi:hypothetical protein
MAQLVVRTRGALRGYWLGDDWGLLSNFAQFSISLREPFTIYASHLQPATFLLLRFVQDTNPGSYDTAVLVGALLQAFASVLAYLVLRRLFGPRPTVALLMLFFAFSAAALSSSLAIWSTFYYLPLQIAVAGSVLLLLRYLEQPSTGRALVVVAAQVGALFLNERTVLIPFILFGLAAWFPLVTARPLGWRDALIEHRRVWFLLGAVVAVYACFYAILASRSDTPTGIAPFDAGFQDVVRLTGVVIFKAFVTSMFGGPWQWTHGRVEVAADPSTVLVVLAGVLLFVLVVWTSLRHRTARAAWVFLLGYLFVDVALVTYSRLSEFGPEVGGYFRYSADAVLPATLMLGFALLSTRAQQTPAVEPRHERSNRRRTLKAGALITIAGAFLVSAGISDAGVFEAWSSNPAKRYAENARAGFKRVEHTGMLVQFAPEPVLGRLFAPRNTTNVLLSSMPGSPEFRPSVDRLFALDRRGRIRPAQVVPGSYSLPGPEPGCGWAITAPSGSVRLDGTPYDWSWFLHVSYKTATSFTGTAALGDASTIVRFTSGRHDVYFSLKGSGSEVLFRDVPSNTKLCVESIKVGNLDVELEKS